MLIAAIAVFPDGRRMVTASYDKTLCLWDLENGALMKKMEGHRGGVEAVAVSGDGKLTASGDLDGELLAWHGDTGRSLTQAIRGHSERITSLCFSPDRAVLATVSLDKIIQFWRTDTWQIQGHPINSGGEIYCVRYSPSGELLAISTPSAKVDKPDEALEGLTRPYKVPLGLVNIGRPAMSCEEAAFLGRPY